MSELKSVYDEPRPVEKIKFPTQEVTIYHLDEMSRNIKELSYQINLIGRIREADNRYNDKLIKVLSVYGGITTTLIAIIFVMALIISYTMKIGM